MRWLLLFVSLSVLAQEKTETRELIGQIGNRSALLVLHSSRNEDGSSRLTGEYIVLPVLQRRFVDGESSPEIGVTSLREGTTPILFGREPTGELRGTLRGGVFKGIRYGPGGQVRERFEFGDEFPAMTGYSATVRCEARDAAYVSSLAYAVDAGTIKSLEWRSTLTPSGHSCNVAAGEQRTFKGGLQLVSGRCTVTLRDLGDYVRVAAENCAELCGSQAFLEPLLVDKRGACRLLRPETR
ncbi:MAG TPA: hypothetical protein VM140_14510 [Burkholderiales bacterium]|nr:hypothetical protein [Burkholderiales bacterium]